MVVMDPNRDMKVKPTKEFPEMLSVLYAHGLHTLLSCVRHFLKTPGTLPDSIIWTQKVQGADIPEAALNQ